MPSQFCIEAADQLRQKKSLTPKERRLLRVLEDDSPGPIRKRRQAQLEAHVKAGMRDDLTGKIDWSSIDWKALFDKILKIMIQVLPLILAII